MSEVKTITLECAGCTAPLSEAIVAKGVYRCPFCGYVNILPKEDQTSEVKHYLYNGDAELKDYEFERAYNAYSKAVELDPTESKAYFGMALASNRVKYIKDVVNNRWQAICCEVTDKKFSEDKNYLRALEVATPEQREEYTSRATEIDYIREKFAELEASGLDYDTFICVKVTDDNGDFTQDSMWANRLYDSISKTGAKPFYSEKEIGDRVGADYEALILYALYKSESMIIVCSNEDYLRTPWLQNEYTRYYSMLTGEEKAKNSIMIAFSGHVIERIPGMPGRIQGADLHSFDTSQKVNDFVNKFANAKEHSHKKTEEKNLTSKQKNKKRRIASISSVCAIFLVALIMLLSLLLRPNLEYTKVDGGYAVSSVRNPKRLEAVEIPDTHNGKPVVSILDDAFAKSTNLTRITIPNSIKTINSNVFENCPITDATIPAGASASIPKAYLKNLTITGNEETVAESVFSGCAFLETLIIEEGIIAIEKDAFYDCKNLKSVKISNSVKLIGTNVFGECNSIEKAVFSADFINSISKNALTDITITTGTINSSSFSNCKTLKSVTIGDGVTSIKSNAFQNCTLLKDVTISDSVNSIGYGIFSGCTMLQSITIPSGITSIESQMFSGCTSLESVTIPNGVHSIGSHAFFDCNKLKSITLPDSVISIGDYAFRNCTSLEGITLSSSITTIGIQAFYGCKKLKNITIPDKVTSIEANTFYGCTSLESVILPQNLTSIEEGAFSECTSLKSIIIPNRVSFVGYGVFENCTSLENIYCVATKKPTGWDGRWKNGCTASSVWGYKGE